MSKDKLMPCLHIAQFKTHYRDKSPYWFKLISVFPEFEVIIQPQTQFIVTCSSWSQALAGSRMWCADGKGTENYLSVHWLKRTNILSLLWRISNMEKCLLEVCPMASPLISAWPSISGPLKTERPQNICSTDTCSEKCLRATTCVLWREAIKHVFSFPGAHQDSAQGLQCLWCLAVANQLVCSRIWTPPEFYL